jgi:hypothetical protein
MAFSVDSGLVIVVLITFALLLVVAMLILYGVEDNCNPVDNRSVVTEVMWQHFKN